MPLGDTVNEVMYCKQQIWELSKHTDMKAAYLRNFVNASCGTRMKAGFYSISGWDGLLSLREEKTMLIVLE